MDSRPINTMAAAEGVPINAPPNAMEFGEALKILRRGGAVSRTGWNGQGQRIQLAKPVPAAYMRRYEIELVEPNVQFFVIINPNNCGLIVPWFPSATDLLADDWFEVPLTVNERAGRE